MTITGDILERILRASVLKNAHIDISPVKNIIAIFTSIMLHCEREIRDVIKSISNVNYLVFLDRLFKKKLCRAHVLNPSI